MWNFSCFLCVEPGCLVNSRLLEGFTSYTCVNRDSQERARHRTWPHALRVQPHFPLSSLGASQPLDIPQIACNSSQRLGSGCASCKVSKAIHMHNSAEPQYHTCMTDASRAPHPQLAPYSAFPFTYVRRPRLHRWPDTLLQQSALSRGPVSHTGEQTRWHAAFHCTSSRPSLVDQCMSAVHHHSGSGCKGYRRGHLCRALVHRKLGQPSMQICPYAPVQFYLGEQPSAVLSERQHISLAG